MPMYEFHCPNCGESVEKLFRTFSTAETEIECPRCGKMMTKDVSSPAVHFRGPGWTVPNGSIVDPTSENSVKRVQNVRPDQRVLYK